MSQDDDREVFPFPGKVKSSVWEFFGFYKNIYGTLDKSRAICKLCKKGVNYSGNTTNLRTHIVHHHKNIASSYDYTRPGYAGGSRSSTLNSDANLNQSFQSQSTVDSFLHIVSPGKNTRHTYEEILVTPETAGCSSKNIIHGPSWMTEVVSEVHNKENPLQENSSGSFADSDVESSSGYMYVRELVFDAIIHDLIPLESLDTSRFQKLIGFGRRNVIVPSSEDITNDILKRFNDLQAVVFSDLSLMPNKSYKIEFWETSCYQYVTIYVSGMYDNWKARNFVLSTTELQSNEVEDVMDVLNEKILDVGGSIVVSSSNEVTTQYTEDKNCIFLEALCCTIDKAAKICIQESVVYNLIKKVQKVVKHFSKYETEALLREKQAALNMPSKELISCNIKVWTSCLDMFEVIQEQSNAVIAACMDSVTDDMKDGKLLNADFALIQTVISILKPLKTAINLTKDMKYPTASVVLPVMKKLEVCLTKTDADWCIIAELKAKMVSALKESYENESVRDFLLLSSFLDPRFKGLKFVDQSDQDHAHDLLKKSALEMKNQSVQPRDSSTNGSSSALKLDAIVKIEVDDDYQGGACTSWSTGVGKQKSETNENEPKLKKIKVKNQTTQINDSLADDWFADVILELKEDKAEEDSVSVEINRYKCEMQVSSSASPLTWWRDRQKSFPLLSEVAKRYIFVPCVLGCKDDVSEKWFKRQRNSIAPNLVEPLLFLHSNYDKFVCK